MNPAFPVTSHAISAITQKEPIILQPCRVRALSLLNATVYVLRIFVDPICNICQVCFHLFKAFYHCTAKKNSFAESKIEAIKSIDFLISSVSAPVFNSILAGKCLAGSFVPTICYRQANSKELAIIQQFQKFQQKSLLLSSQGIDDIKNLNVHTHVHIKMKKLKQASAKTRAAYFKLKLYTI